MTGLFSVSALLIVPQVRGWGIGPVTLTNGTISESQYGGCVIDSLEAGKLFAKTNYFETVRVLYWMCLTTVKKRKLGWYGHVTRASAYRKLSFNVSFKAEEEGAGQTKKKKKKGGQHC